jgi:hypothetical protein
MYESVQLSLSGGTTSFGDRKSTGEVLLFTDFSFGIKMADGILTESLSTHVLSGMLTDVLYISSSESLEDVPLFKGFLVGISMGDDPLSTDFESRIVWDRVS